MADRAAGRNQEAITGPHRLRVVRTDDDRIEETRRIFAALWSTRTREAPDLAGADLALVDSVVRKTGGWALLRNAPDTDRDLVARSMCPMLMEAIS